MNTWITQTFLSDDDLPTDDLPIDDDGPIGAAAKLFDVFPQHILELAQWLNSPNPDM